VQALGFGNVVRRPGFSFLQHAACLARLGQLFLQLVPRAALVVPVEADFRGGLLQFVRALQRRQTLGHAVQRRVFLAPALDCLLYRVPLVDHRVGRVRGRVAEHMRMPADYLVGNRVQRVGGPKVAVLLVHHREHRGQQIHVAQFLADVRLVALVHRLHQLVCFLDQVGADAGRRLFAVPGAAVRRAQSLYYRVQAVERLFRFGRLCIHAPIVQQVPCRRQGRDRHPILALACLSPYSDSLLTDACPIPYHRR